MNKGKIVQVIGPVVDCEFQKDKLPKIFNALKLKEHILEVESHIGDNTVRCISLAPTDGFARGMEVEDTGSPIKIPVGRACLGRVMDLLGNPIDHQGEIKYLKPE